LYPINALNVIQTLKAVDHQLVALVSEDRVNRPHCTHDLVNVAAKLGYDLDNLS
jgi:hypothetical protein